jgi:hypothetical protein
VPSQRDIAHPAIKRMDRTGFLAPQPCRFALTLVTDYEKHVFGWTDARDQPESSAAKNIDSAGRRYTGLYVLLHQSIAAVDPGNDDEKEAAAKAARKYPSNEDSPIPD